MTRINCVPPGELTNAHLGAEYRELPRVFKLAYQAWLRGDDPSDYPKDYTLGKGHVKFFYTRLGYLTYRFSLIVAERQRRGLHCTYTEVPAVPLMPASWHADWEPTPAALAINRHRIAERLKGSKRP